MIRYLIDTNIIVYPQDGQEEAKRVRAGEVLHLLAEAKTAALPSQALAEFSNTSLKKLRVAPANVMQRVELLTEAFPVLPLNAAVVLEAVRGVRDYQLSYYDAQIWAAAKLNQIPTVLSEDFNTGGGLEGITFLNPLEPAFDPASL